MKTTKMSLANMQGKLSRTEMKNIMAGSGSGACFVRVSCGGGGTCMDPATTGGHCCCSVDGPGGVYNSNCTNWGNGH